MGVARGYQRRRPVSVLLTPSVIGRLICNSEEILCCVCSLRRIWTPFTPSSGTPSNRIWSLLPPIPISILSISAMPTACGKVTPSLNLSCLAFHQFSPSRVYAPPCLITPLIATDSYFFSSLLLLSIMIFLAPRLPRSQKTRL